MKQWSITFDPQAINDLGEIRLWIASQASEAIADRYAERLVSFCRQLDLFPQRGEARDDLYPGLRVVVFERRVSVAFKLYENDVRIVRLFYASCDLAAAFSPD